MIEKPKREHILLTGGGGYIGAVTAEKLLEQNYDVTILDTFYWGFHPIEKILPKIKIIQTDIREVNSKHLKGISAIIHAAGLSNDPMANFNPKANYEINTKATIKLARLAKKAGVKRFIFASSASIYDKKDLSATYIQNESSKVFPKAAYSVSKLKAEKALLKLASKNFCLTIFRQGTVYGFSPKMRYDLVVNTMLKDALQSGKIKVLCKGRQWRPLIDVQDVASAYITAIQAEPGKINGQVFNLVYKNYKIGEVANLIKKTLKKHKNMKLVLEITNSNRVDRSYQISGEKIIELLNWRPKISVEESIIDMLGKLKGDYLNFSHPRFYNIEWMKMLIEIEGSLKKVKKVFQ